jgi:protein involved in polysaccharide export with SLBB domain
MRFPPSLSMHTFARTAAALLLAAFSALSGAQTTPINTDPLNTGPRGLTEIPSRRAPGVAAAAASAPAPAPVPQTQPGDPRTSAAPVVFGSQIFTGRFGNEAFSGFNPDHQIAVGDRISVRMWGAFTFDAVQAVDVRGNIFIPNVGPVNLLGVRNADLNRQLEAQLKRTFRSNVGVYATLEAAQPVKVYVTGFVRSPGLYGGLSSDSVLYYLDRAGGIDPDRGSYLQVDVLRGGKPRARFDLYAFLLEGRMEPLQLQDGDTIVVQARRHSVRVDGAVANPYIFEIDKPSVTAADLLKLARPLPNATHLSVVRNVGTERRGLYQPLAEAGAFTIRDGDEVTVTSDTSPGTILVRVDGAIVGERTLVLPYGSRLKDAVARIRPAPQARVEALQLFRKSVAARQKELIEVSVRGLETYALTARSATSEEAALRGREAQSILEFIDRVRRVQPRGQVVLADAAGAGETLLENGDNILVPEQSNVVQVSGEVLFPNALVFDGRLKVDDYVARAGGFTQGADRAKVLVLRQDGTVTEAAGAELRPGDEIMAMPKIETKNVELTRGISQIVYQIAVAAKVLFGL